MTILNEPCSTLVAPFSPNLANLVMFFILLLTHHGNHVDQQKKYYYRLGWFIDRIMICNSKLGLTEEVVHDKNDCICFVVHFHIFLMQNQYFLAIRIISDRLQMC